MNLQKFFGKNTIITLAIILIIGASFLFFLNINKWHGFQPSSNKKKDAFLFGATIRPYALREDSTKQYDPKNTVDQELSYLKELGANTVRLNLELDWDLNDYMIDQINKNYLNSIIILEEKIDFTEKNDYESRGYGYGKLVAEKYKGKITYYQMLNEVSGITFKKSAGDGPELNNRYGLKFDKNKYDNVRDYLKGMSRAIKEKDPNAKRIISGNWVLVDIIKYLIDDGIDFELVGWNWFSGIGDDITNKKIDEGGIFNLPEIIKGWGKDLLIIEFNKDDGSYNSKEAEQADFIKSFLSNKNNLDKTKGIIFFPLTDSTEQGPIGSLGLIKINKNESTGNMIFTDKKPAFYSFQEIIKNHLYLDDQAK